MSWKTRHVLLAQFLILTSSLSLLTFKDYINQSEELISSYQVKSNPEGASTPEHIGPIKPFIKPVNVENGKIIVKTAPKKPVEKKVMDEGEKALDILADPSK